MAGNLTVPGCPYTGPNCTFGVDHAFELCFGLVKPGTYDLFDKARVAACVFGQVNQFEQTVMSANAYILTLWPAIVGIIGALGPDASDIVCDNIWWSLIFAITSAGLPGSTRTPPPHHLTVANVEQGESICRGWKYSHNRPREIARHKNSKVHAAQWTALVWEMILFAAGIGFYALFNYFFIKDLKMTILLGRSSPYISGTWYWLSAMPISLLFFSEIIQDRVDLYEPRGYEALSPSPMDQKSSYHIESISRQSSSMSHATLSRIPLTGQHTTTEFAKVTHFVIPFFSKWFRIIRHQCSGTQYRLLVRPSSQKWLYFVWNLAVGLVRVTLFTLGSVMMGQIVLWPMVKANQLTMALLVVTSALPRLVYPSIWASSSRGADLVVTIDPIDVHTSSMF